MILKISKGVSNPIHYGTHKGVVYYREDYVNNLKEEVNLWVGKWDRLKDENIELKEKIRGYENE